MREEKSSSFDVFEWSTTLRNQIEAFALVQSYGESKEKHVRNQTISSGIAGRALTLPDGVNRTL